MLAYSQLGGQERTFVKFSSKHRARQEKNRKYIIWKGVFFVSASMCLYFDTYDVSDHTIYHKNAWRGITRLLLETVRECPC